MFDSMLGTWNKKLVGLELNDEVNPVLLRPYPVPKVHIYMFKKEVELSVSVSILKKLLIGRSIFFPTKIKYQSSTIYY